MIACIGTREFYQQNPDSIKKFSLRIDNLGKNEIISTGAAIGVDQFSALRHLKNGGKVILHLPWKNYEESFVNSMKNEFEENVIVNVLSLEDNEAMETVSKYHPNFRVLSRGAKLLHARNYLIVKESIIVLAFPLWKNGKPGGGTMQGVRIAENLNIPVELFGKGELF